MGIQYNINYLSDLIGDRVDSYNEKLKNGKHFYSYPFPDKDYKFNISTTLAPVFDGKDQLVNIYLNGLTYDKKTKSNNAMPNTVVAPRYENSHSN